MRREKRDEHKIQLVDTGKESMGGRVRQKILALPASRMHLFLTIAQGVVWVATRALFMSISIFPHCSKWI